MAGTEKILLFLTVINKTTQMRAHRVIGDHRYRPFRFRLRFLRAVGIRAGLLGILGLSRSLQQIHRPNRHILVAAPFITLVLDNGELHRLARRQVGHIRQPDKLRVPLRCRLTGQGIEHHAHTSSHRHRAEGCSNGARGTFDKIPPIRLGILFGRNVFLGHNCGGSSSVFKESYIRRLNLPCNSKRLPQETTGDNHQC